MNIETKKDVIEVLKMPGEVFEKEILPQAKMISDNIMQDELLVTTMAGISNICKNHCLYCGMRADNNKINRYRMEPEKVIEMCLDASKKGFKRTFLITGEDPKYGFDNILKIAETLKLNGFFISLACGELEKQQFDELRMAGVDEYVLKFEMSNPDSFNRLNPSTDFQRRMKSIEYIKAIGMKLASGNIVGWPGQSLEELAEDIMLMKQLEISWAPVIPFMPVANTPLGAEGKPGDLLLLYKEIALLRLMMPEVNITAQQPGKVLANGLSDQEGNIAAINAGANVLFYDLLTDDRANDFKVIDNRNITGSGHIFNLSRITGKKLVLE